MMKRRLPAVSGRRGFSLAPIVKAIVTAAAFALTALAAPSYAQSTQARALPLINPSFEVDDATSGGGRFVLRATGWVLQGAAGTLRPPSAGLTDGVPDGIQALFVSPDAAAQQAVSLSSMTAGDVIVLRIAMGRRADLSGSPGTAQIALGVLNGDGVTLSSATLNVAADAAPVAGAFAFMEVNVTLGEAAVAEAAAAVVVTFAHRDGSQVLFDAVSLLVLSQAPSTISTTVARTTIATTASTTTVATTSTTTAATSTTTAATTSTTSTTSTVTTTATTTTVYTTSADAQTDISPFAIFQPLPDPARYTLAHLGAVGREGDPRRFSTAFDADNLAEPATIVASAGACALRCEHLEPCLGFLIYVVNDAGRLQCRPLTALGVTSGAPTSTVSLSFQRLLMSTPSPTASPTTVTTSTESTTLTSTTTPVPPARSCKGRCGLALSADGSCHCDGIFCILVGDCCANFEVDCPQTTPAGDTATNINLSTSSSQPVDLSLSPLSTTVSKKLGKGASVREFLCPR